MQNELSIRSEKGFGGLGSLFSEVKKGQWKGREIVVLVAGFGAAGALGGFLFAGPLGAMVGAVIGVVMGIFYAGSYMVYESQKQLFKKDFSQPVEFDFRDSSDDVIKQSEVVRRMLEYPNADPLNQIKLDTENLRMEGNLSVQAFGRLVDSELSLDTVQNIIFANCQDFEIEVRKMFSGCLENEKSYWVTQDGAIDDTTQKKSTLMNDQVKRTTTLTSRLKVYDIAADYKVVERFEATAVLHWDAGVVTITKGPIPPS